MIELKTAEDENRVVQARALFQEYAETRKGDPALVDFPEEIRNLPGGYAPPDGNIILAYSDGKLAGCVAVHKLDDDTCEMKRLYVSPVFRGKGIGRRLVVAVLEQARMIGYSRMRLDSIPAMREAQTLYETIGFYEIPDYRNNPNKGTKYYEMELRGDSIDFKR
ncbi:MAG: GNAT family N-acetyltransferase [Deltaproteobacteria bacterium]|nr:MAG: GNAT family N-acetyltransferase [Deltaproteobacteria bacterium]